MTTKLIELIGTIQSSMDIRRMYKRIEREERYWHELPSYETLNYYLKVTERAISEAKKADTYEDSLWWLERAKRNSLRFWKVKNELEKAGP